MDKEVKAGSAYIEIIAKSEQLKSQIKNIESDAKKAAANFESAFKTMKLDIDNRIMVMKFSQLQALHKALTVQLQQKIKLDADVASIEKTRIALNSVEDAIGRTGAKAGHFNSGVGMSFNRIIQDSAYVTNGLGFWMQAVGNNITNFAENLQYARQRGESFKTMFAGMFTGMNLWVMIISTVVSVITAFAMANRKSKDDIEKHAKSIKEIAESYKNLQEKIAAANEELRNTKSIDFATTFRALLEEIKITQKEYDELIKKKKYWDEVNKIGAGTSGQSGYASVVSLFTNPSKEEQKKLEDEIKKDKAMLDEANRLGRLLADAQKASEKGSFTQFLKNTSDKDTKFVLDTFKEWGERLNSYQQVAFNAFNQNILLTKSSANQLTDQLEKAWKPKIDKEKTLTDYGYLQPMLDKLKKLEEYKPFAKTEQQAIDLQQAINAVNRELDDAKAKIKILAEGRNTSLSDLPVRGPDKVLQFNNPKEKHPGRMWDTDNYKESKPFLELLNRIGDEINKDEKTAQAFASTISNTFVSGISSGESFINVLSRIILQLTEMVAQALLFEWIFKMIAPVGIKSGGMFQGIFGKTLAPMSSLPIAQGSNQVATRYLNSDIANKLDAINNSVQAVSLNTIKSRRLVVPVSIDGKVVAVAVTEIQDEMARGNVRGRG